MHGYYVDQLEYKKEGKSGSHTTRNVCTERDAVLNEERIVFLFKVLGKQIESDGFVLSPERQDW